MAKDQDGQEIGSVPIRGLDGEIIGEVTRVSFFEETTGEALIEMRIDGDVARQGHGFTGHAGFRIKIWENEMPTSLPELVEALTTMVQADRADREDQGDPHG